MSCKVMVVEDEAMIREMVVINLTRAGFETCEVGSGEEALEDLDRLSPDVVLLDINLPGMNGFEVCRQLRKRNAGVGVIMLTARSQEEDRIDGLRNGADDYVTKPFSPGELIARVEALRRRLNLGASVKSEKDLVDIVSGPFCYSQTKRHLTKNGQEVDITQVEYQILGCLMKKEGAVMSRQQIYDQVWPNSAGDLKVVDVNIRRLRMKIEDDPSLPIYLQTVWGTGYRWNIP